MSFSAATFYAALRSEALFFTAHRSQITGHVLSALRHSRLCVSRFLF
jgi:hypothetical protein